MSASQQYATESRGAPSLEGNTTEITHGDTVKAQAHAHGEGIHLPKPTAWPIVTALGFTLLVSGVLTHYVISILGFLMLTYGCVGWFRDVLPQEAHEEIEVRVQEISIESSRKSVARINAGTDKRTGTEHRTHVGEGSFSPLAGLKGGVAGGIAMIFPALAYGLIGQHSPWFPVNLLGGAGMMGGPAPTMEYLRAFHAGPFGIAILIHVVTCLLIGLVYGSALPIMPKHPILLGGLLAPLAWTGLLSATLPIINPEISEHVNWPSFLLAQLTFGLVAGYVVSRSPYYKQALQMPLSMRLGLEGSGMGHEEDNKNSGDRR